jgi:hypothetical protein
MAPLGFAPYLDIRCPCLVLILWMSLSRRAGFGAADSCHLWFDDSTTTTARYVGPAPVRQGRSGRSRSPPPPPGAISELDIRLLSQVITVVSRVEHGAGTRQNNLAFRMEYVIRVMRRHPREALRARPERRSAARWQHEPRTPVEPRPAPAPALGDPGSRCRHVSCTTGPAPLCTRAEPPDRVVRPRRGNVPDHRTDIPSSTRRHLLTSPGPGRAEPERWRRVRTSTCRWGADEWRQGRGQPP